MTIAACHVSPEGVVLGTDSTTTITSASRSASRKQYYHDYEQKLFEVGPPNSNVGLATWGVGRIGNLSHRTIAARLGKKHKSDCFTTLDQMAHCLGNEIQREILEFYGPMLPEDDSNLIQKWQKNPSSVSEEETDRLNIIHSSTAGGYFLAGKIDEASSCQAYDVSWSIVFDKPRIRLLEVERPHFRGVPHIMQRLVKGYDENLAQRILDSPLWKGNKEDLLKILDAEEFLVRPELLPLRDAIDWIHTVIHTTIRANKFSGWHACGGPVEVAVITTDRSFRWVCHKRLDAAIITAQEGVFH